MSLWGDFDGEMQRLPLDPDTADRLLAGDVLREDAPPGYQEVVSLLNGLRAAERHALAREQVDVECVLAGRGASLSETTRSPRRSKMRRLALTGVALAAALTCTTALALAGTLPGAAQDIASSMLAKVGVTVPGPDEHAGMHPSVRGTSSPDVADAARARTREERPAGSDSQQSDHGKGSEVSQLATTTDLTGVEKGAAISTLASGGKSQAGQHGQASSHTGSQGHTGSNPGAATAAAASGGRSSAGAGNSAAGQSHRP